jgi:hypothetical protein
LVVGIVAGAVPGAGAGASGNLLFCATAHPAAKRVEAKIKVSFTRYSRVVRTFQHHDFDSDGKAT